MKLTILLSSILFLGSTLMAQKPSVAINSNKRILTLDDEKPNANITKLESKFVAAGTKKISTAWSISGVQDKDWVIKSGDLSSGEIEIQFKKVGNYTVAVTVGYSEKVKQKNGTFEDVENDVEAEEENFITVTNNLDELTQIHADSNFVKLVKKAADYVAKPKFANDPTPTIFLAKGYFGMYRKSLKDALITDPYEEAIVATATAIEMDQNGIFYTPVHRMWLNGFQTEVINNEIVFKLDDLDGYPAFYTGKDLAKKAQLIEEMMEGVEKYSTITKNPIAVKLLEAAIRYNAKDVKGANLIYKTEIPNLLKIEKIDKFSDADKQALKLGVILSAQILPIIDKNNTNTCAIMKKIAPWFEKDKDFIAIFEKKYNSCMKE
ncbi:MAG: hypothetical protein RL264_2474 [Bacteroidota bacterium]